MARRFYQLPSLTGLNTFDACARHGSFTGAAAELGVTPGAVSRQIKSLEDELKCPLFRRQYRGVELTAEGLDLHQVVSSGFRQIGRLCQDLKSRGSQADVTIAATTAFATLWLMPRLSGFWQAHNEIELNHSISDNPNDPGFVNADMRIRYGDGNWRGEVAMRLFDDVIYPVCGRDFLANHKISRPEDIVDLPLLKLDGLDPSWTGWQVWLAEFGFDSNNSKFRRFNNYVVALQAAEENQGVVLGWHSMVSPLIENGRLMRLGDMEIAAPGSYYLTWEASRPLSPAANLLRQWLVEFSATIT